MKLFHLHNFISFSEQSCDKGRAVITVSILCLIPCTLLCFFFYSIYHFSHNNVLAYYMACIFSLFCENKNTEVFIYLTH